MQAYLSSGPDIVLEELHEIRLFSGRGYLDLMSIEKTPGLCHVSSRREFEHNFAIDSYRS